MLDRQKDSEERQQVAAWLDWPAFVRQHLTSTKLKFNIKIFVSLKFKSNLQIWKTRIKKIDTFFETSVILIPAYPAKRVTSYQSNRRKRRTETEESVRKAQGCTLLRVSPPTCHTWPSTSAHTHSLSLTAFLFFDNRFGASSFCYLSRLCYYKSISPSMRKCSW